MASLTRCPCCDTFVRDVDVVADTCPFCPTTNAANLRNPIPGLVLAATIAVLPGCTGGDDTDVPVYGIAIDAGPADAAPATDSMPTAPDAEDSPIYGIAPE